MQEYLSLSKYFTDIGIFQLLNRYLCKGSDAAIFSVDDPNNMDEIKSFQLGRYVSSHEVSKIVYSSISLNFDLKGNEKKF